MINEKIKIGDVVRYRGWETINEAKGIVVAESSPESSFHHRIRIMWTGSEIPIQASVLSIKNSRITTWVNPSNFEVILSK
jgi:hypothetical protein